MSPGAPMKSAFSTILGAAVAAIIGAVMGSVLTHVFVSRQIMSEQRIEMAVESFSDYFKAMATLDKDARLAAVGSLAVVLDERTIKALGTFESGIGPPGYIGSPQGRQAFANLVMAMRRHLQTGSVSETDLRLVLFGEG